MTAPTTRSPAPAHSPAAGAAATRPAAARSAPAQPLTVAEIAEFTRRLAAGTHSRALAEIETSDLTAVLTGLEEIKNAAAAAQARVTDSVATRLRDEAIAKGVAPERADQGIRRQIGLARRESPHAGSRHIGFARAIVHEMPNTHAAMTAGVLTEWTATQLVRETACLSREQRATVDARLAGRLGTDSHKKLVAGARALAYELDPYAFVNRGRKAARHRRVSVRPAPDVMSLVSGFLPVAQGVACFKALDDSARALKSAGDERTLDQLRADLFIERLTGAQAADNTVIELGLVMTDAALLGLDETAARLDGLGPLPAGLARDLARKAASWLRRLYADPVTGVLTGRDPRRRKFTGTLRQLLVARDQVCRTPYCDAPIRHADHVLPFARGGTTTEDNGQGQCEACNYDKESAGGRAETIASTPGTHLVRITTPTGQVFESHAPPVLPTLGLAAPRESDSMSDPPPTDSTAPPTDSTAPPARAPVSLTSLAPDGHLALIPRRREDIRPFLFAG